jgi:transposase
MNPLFTDESAKTFEPSDRAGVANESSDQDEPSPVTSPYKEFALPSSRAKSSFKPTLRMNPSTPEPPPLAAAAFVGIDWADQKHDVVLRSAAEPAKVEHHILAHEVNAVLDWINQLQQRFGSKGKVLVCLEQSRGALIYQLMGYGLFELYPINPSQLANYRKAFATSGAKADRPDADLLCELVYCHRDRLKAWKPDDALTRKLATLNEDRRKAVDRRTELANEIKSQLKLYFPLALQVLDNDTSSALAADLLLQWPTLDTLQKASPHKLRKFFYGHNCRHEQKLLERLRLIQEAKPLLSDLAVIEPAVLRLQMLARATQSPPALHRALRKADRRAL